ncbi:MAG: hypothetical protein QNI90_15740 [Dinoroseobacter sp.]|nr:hypothetical protein [Dinoroseobacter sp.]
MKTLLLYYSFSGVTRGVAHEIATALDADEAEIVCSAYRSGFLGYLHAGFDSIRGKLPPVRIEPGVSLSDYDRVIVGGPVWTGSAATPLRAALEALQDWPAEVGLLLTSGGQKNIAPAVEQVEKSLSRGLCGICHLTATDLKSEARKERVMDFLAQLANAAPDPSGLVAG